MDVEITFVSGRVIRTYDVAWETPGAARQRLNPGTGWVDVGGHVFHIKQVESLRWLDPDTTTQEASSS